MQLLGILFKILIFIIIGVVVFVLVSNIWIYISTSENVYDRIEEVPSSQVALVLGTSHRLIDGSPNPYFHKRMETAAALYKAGKVKHILVSGDNATKYYNEPNTMRKALIKLGVSSKDITLDYAGFRTLDSIIRCKKIFGQDDVIIITQPFHSYRALFISYFYEMDAIAMTTQEAEISPFKMYFREYLARALAVWDLYVIKKGPKFLGEKETLDL